MRLDTLAVARPISDDWINSTSPHQRIKPQPINLMKTYNSSINESSLSRIWRQAQAHDVGTISGWRNRLNCGDGRALTSAEKGTRNVILKSQLLMMGYGVTPIKGVYIENFGTPQAVRVREESFLVVDLKDNGHLKQDLIALGQKFEQDSVTFQSAASNTYYLISSNTCPDAYPGKGKIGVELKLGSAMFGTSGQFFSTVSGRPFVFEGALYPDLTRLDELRHYGPTEIRGIEYWSKQEAT